MFRTSGELRFSQTAGEVSYRIPSHEERVFVVATPEAIVTSFGARFSLGVATAGTPRVGRTTVFVAEGQVEVASKSGEVTLEAGETLTVSGSARIHSRRQPSPKSAPSVPGLRSAAD